MKPFMKPRTAQKIRNFLLILGVVVMLCAFVEESLFVVGAVIASTCFIPELLFNKCTHCGKHLGRNDDEFCPNCGKPID